MAECSSCHGSDFGGGLLIDAAPVARLYAANNTPTAIGRAKEEDFLRARRDGKRPGGPPSETPMSFRFTNERTDGEVRALCMDLKAVPPKVCGGREADASRWVERTTNGLGRRRY
jgi:hypothetical protein